MLSPQACCCNPIINTSKKETWYYFAYEQENFPAPAKSQEAGEGQKKDYRVEVVKCVLTEESLQSYSLTARNKHCNHKQMQHWEPKTVILLYWHRMLGQQWRACSLLLVRTQWQEGPVCGHCFQIACVRAGLWDGSECRDRQGLLCGETGEPLHHRAPRVNVLKSSGNQNSTEACSAFHLNVNAYIYTLQSLTCVWLFGLEPKASSADLCKLMRHTDSAGPRDAVSCPRVSGICFLCHHLDSIRFLTRILRDYVSKSGSQWEVLFLVKEATLEGDFCCGLMDTIWMAQQTDRAA